jgi:hypothetical protein
MATVWALLDVDIELRRERGSPLPVDLRRSRGQRSDTTVDSCGSRTLRFERKPLRQR